MEDHKEEVEEKIFQVNIDALIVSPRRSQEMRVNKPENLISPRDQANKSAQEIQCKEEQCFFSQHVCSKEIQKEDFFVLPAAVFSSNSAPTMSITTITINTHMNSFVTGSHDGLLCLWQLNLESFEMHMTHLLIGHTKKIVCACFNSSSRFLFTWSRDRTLSKWDLTELHCVKAVEMSTHFHTKIEAYEMATNQAADTTSRLFCIGEYAGIVVLNLQLATLFILSTNTHDKISCFCVYDQDDDQNIVLGMSTRGHSITWKLPSKTNNIKTYYISQTERLKRECLQISRHLLNGSILMVYAGSWQICDVNCAVLFEVPAPSCKSWVKAQFLSIDTVLATSNMGQGYLYKVFAKSSDFQSSSNNSPTLHCVLKVEKDKPFLRCPEVVYGRNVMIRGDYLGNINCWKISEEITDVPNELIPVISLTFRDAWKSTLPLSQCEKKKLYDCLESFASSGIKSKLRSFICDPVRRCLKLDQDIEYQKMMLTELQNIKAALPEVPESERRTDEEVEHILFGSHEEEKEEEEEEDEEEINVEDLLTKLRKSHLHVNHLRSNELEALANIDLRSIRPCNRLFASNYQEDSILELMDRDEWYRIKL